MSDKVLKGPAELLVIALLGIIVLAVAFPLITAANNSGSTPAKVNAPNLSYYSVSQNSFRDRFETLLLSAAGNKTLRLQKYYCFPKK